MKVFISWSGEPSRSIARALDSWLERVVQPVDAWISTHDIASGARWNEAITKQLDETNFGIVCVTMENQSAPWLTFEAGALAKSVERGRVVPLCIDLRPSDLRWPLAAFQARSLGEAAMRTLVHDINAACEKPIPKDALDDVFEAMWPRLKAAIDKALTGAPSAQEPQRSQEDMLAEVVEIVRALGGGNHREGLRHSKPS